MIELAFFVLFGALLGIVTGLIPGFHPNLMATLMMGYLFFPPFESSVFLIAAGVTHTFMNFVPAIYLGAPSEATALSVLPGHKMLLEGRGYEAVRLTVVGGLLSFLVVVSVLPFAFLLVPVIYSALESYIHVVLILIIGFMFFKDRSYSSVLIFFLSGALGYAVLTMNFIGTRHDLFPLLAGLFGISMLIQSVRKNPRIPTQNRSLSYIGKRTAVQGGLIGGLGGVLVGLLPGIGSAQATYIAQELTGEGNVREFMVAIGGVNTSNIIFSLLAIYLIGKPRSGVAVAVSRMMAELSFSTVLLFVGLVVVVSGFAAFSTLFVSKRSLSMFRKMDYRKLCIGVMIFILSMSFVVTGWKGVFVALIGSVLGLACILSGTRRSYLMGCILVPVILFFL